MRFIEIDQAVVFAILGNLTTLIFGPLTALLIITRFSPALQGFYYSYLSLTMVQFILDFGLGQAIIQFASHEWAGLSISKGGKVSGHSDSLSRLISLGHVALRWYSLASIAILGGLMPIGYLFFSTADAFRIQWTWPWIFLCLGLGLNGLLVPFFYLLQGCNQIAQYWRYRFIQQAIYGLSLCAAILFGAELWALPIASFIGLVWSAVFLLIHYPKFLPVFFSNCGRPMIAWGRELWPVQWKMAISWLSASFTTFFFTPLIFHFSGPIKAGQMGMTVSINSVLLAIASNWTVTKAPGFGILIARRHYEELDQRFSRSLRTSLGAVCLGALFILVTVILMNRFNSPYRDRILPPLPLGLFLAATVLNSIVLNFAIYLRAHKQEPLARTYFIGSFFIMSSSLILAPIAGAVGITAAYLAAILGFQLPASFHIYKRCRGLWHNQDDRACYLDMNL
jgi:O-antigen/teichoic acid export membrane protein